MSPGESRTLTMHADWLVLLRLSQFAMTVRAVPACVEHVSELYKHDRRAQQDRTQSVSHTHHQDWDQQIGIPDGHALVYWDVLVRNHA